MLRNGRMPRGDERDVTQESTLSQNCIFTSDAKEEADEFDGLEDLEIPPMKNTDDDASDNEECEIAYLCTQGIDDDLFAEETKVVSAAKSEDSNEIPINNLSIHVERSSTLSTSRKSRKRSICESRSSVVPPSVKRHRSDLYFDDAALNDYRPLTAVDSFEYMVSTMTAVLYQPQFSFRSLTHWLDSQIATFDEFLGSNINYKAWNLQDKVLATNLVRQHTIKSNVGHTHRRRSSDRELATSWTYQPMTLNLYNKADMNYPLMLSYDTRCGILKSPVPYASSRGPDKLASLVTLHSTPTFEMMHKTKVMPMWLGMEYSKRQTQILTLLTVDHTLILSYDNTQFFTDLNGLLEQFTAEKAIANNKIDQINQSMSTPSKALSTQQMAEIYVDSQQTNLPAAKEYTQHIIEECEVFTESYKNVFHVAICITDLLQNTIHSQRKQRIFSAKKRAKMTALVERLSRFILVTIGNAGGERFSNQDYDVVEAKMRSLQTLLADNRRENATGRFGDAAGTPYEPNRKPRNTVLMGLMPSTSALIARCFHTSMMRTLRIKPQERSVYSKIYKDIFRKEHPYPEPYFGKNIRRVNSASPELLFTGFPCFSGFHFNLEDLYKLYLDKHLTKYAFVRTAKFILDYFTNQFNSQDGTFNMIQHQNERYRMYLHVKDQDTKVRSSIGWMMMIGSSRFQSMYFMRHTSLLNISNVRTHSSNAGDLSSATLERISTAGSERASSDEASDENPVQIKFEQTMAKRAAEPKRAFLNKWLGEFENTKDTLTAMLDRRIKVMFTKGDAESLARKVCQDARMIYLDLIGHSYLPLSDDTYKPDVKPRYAIPVNWSSYNKSSGTVKPNRTPSAPNDSPGDLESGLEHKRALIEKFTTLVTVLLALCTASKTAESELWHHIQYQPFIKLVRRVLPMCWRSWILIKLNYFATILMYIPESVKSTIDSGFRECGLKSN